MVLVLRPLRSQETSGGGRRDLLGAVDAADEAVASPVIKVQLKVDDNGMINIDIIDNGRGFPQENRHMLLEPYVTTRDEGTGLGLPIVAKILEDHGGGIELRDAPGGSGAWVRLYFPLNNAGSASQAEGASREIIGQREKSGN